MGVRCHRRQWGVSRGSQGQGHDEVPQGRNDSLFARKASSSVNRMRNVLMTSTQVHVKYARQLFNGTSGQMTYYPSFYLIGPTTRSFKYHCLSKFGLKFNKYSIKWWIIIIILVKWSLKIYILIASFHFMYSKQHHISSVTRIS